MKIPLSWLKEYVEVSIPVEELAHRLTMAGTEVASVETIGGWDNCYVGQVLQVERHPNADRLTLCTVDIGGEQLRVVCGAPNVAPGQRVPFAKVGAQLFNAHSNRQDTLKVSRIRGEVSEGMICSAMELGLGQDHTGIVVLPDDAPVGQPLSAYMGDQVLDIEVTPNRPDCLSVLGVAREVAALTGVAVHEPDCSYPEKGEPIESITSVDIAAPDLCRRYTASLIMGVKMGPSPQWLQDRLTRAGMRPINNVVDVTNYVMLEYNQPLHAFDFDTVKERHIAVRRAKPGEVLVSLDGVERRLSSSMLVIADGQDPVGLGGVMGGANTEISEKTTAILLESATFDAANNRRTAQGLRLRTEASIRFEKELRPELAPIALRRATQLMLETAGGMAARGIIDIYPEAGQPAPSLLLTGSRLEKVLGIRFPWEQVEQALSSLGFSFEPMDGDGLQVTVPYWRSDINIEDDLVEEVARVIGYDQVPTTMLSTPIPHHQPQPLLELRERIKDALSSAGLQEVITYPVTDLESLRKGANREAIPTPLRLANPLNSRHQYLRTDLRGSILSTLSANQAQQHEPLGIFEIGKVYLPRPGDLPEERERVAGALVGPRRESSWIGKGEEQVGFYDGKGVVDALLQGLGVRATYEISTDPTFAPGRGANILVGVESIGIVGELHSAVVQAFELTNSPVVFFELNVSQLLAARELGAKRYSPLSRFPAAVRDLSIIMDCQTPAAEVQEAIFKHPLTTRVSLFDVYTGMGVPSGKRSLTYRIEFQAQDRTLTAEEANRALETVLRSLERAFGAILRGQSEDSPSIKDAE